MTETLKRRHRPAGPPATVLGRVKRLPAWWLLPAGALAGALAGGAYGVVKTPTYTATSYVLAVPQGESDPTAALGFAQAYGRVATQLAVLGDAQVESGVSPQTLRDSVQAATSPDAPMISISATAAKPGKARDIANAVSRSLTNNANHTKDSTRVRLLQLSRAIKPAAPASASPPMTALVGASAGGLLGGLALLVRPRRTEEAVAAPVPGPAQAADLGREM
ncbi:lipopolysaccharide biosynthesis protein [Streptomyces sp. MZ04]|uniref:lipopolysaccharide biosynthesis protein n=1 Tax=Streptomyces sp. MZ04 TaxID=2559236 RepID=UPI00107E7818|nr:lipopolysaccharide biosynthesis protein [Streptomyces sp. MZ04]TGA95522.1 lipopolysaccharide biosynthesis protein [Streptomyces sp. MZ04]